MPSGKQGFDGSRSWCGRSTPHHAVPNCKDVENHTFHFRSSAWASSNMYAKREMEVGEMVDIGGTIRTGSGGERYVGDAVVSLNSTGSVGPARR